MAGNPQGRRPAYRKVLPDRSRAARDRANQKLVEYIVKARGAESHLWAILRNKKPSRWLKTFLSSGQYMTCVETYLEDEEQLDLVVKYLQGVYEQAGCQLLARGPGDGIRFILDVLLPEVSGQRALRAQGVCVGRVSQGVQRAGGAGCRSPGSSLNLVPPEPQFREGTAGWEQNVWDYTRRLRNTELCNRREFQVC